MPSLTTPDGKPVEVVSADQKAAIDQEFSRAMASDSGDGSDAPPRLDEKAPEAPKRRPGRPRKDEKPRVAEKPSAALPTRVDKDFTEACAGLTTLGWATLAAIPYTTPYACVIDANQEQLVGALNAAAQNNAAIRDAIEKASQGGAGVWALQLAAVGTNMAMQTMQLLKDPQLRKEATAATQGKFRAFLAAQGVQVPEPEPAETPDVAPVAA